MLVLVGTKENIMFEPIEREDIDALYRISCMSDNHEIRNGVVTDENGEVVRYITVRDILDVISIDFREICRKAGYYTFRIDGDDPYNRDLICDYDFYIKPIGNGLKEIPLGLF